jgi:hypothetical protein
MSKINHCLPIERRCEVERVSFAKRNVIIGIPTPQNITQRVKLNNFIEQNRLVSNMPKVILQSKKSRIN